MYPMLTVEENLTFSARIRLPADFTHGQHLHHVEQAIQVGPWSACSCLSVGVLASGVLQATGAAGSAALAASVQPRARLGMDFSRADAVPERGLWG